MSVANVRSLVNEFLDSEGKEVSLSSLISSYGITQFIRRPFDVMQVRLVSIAEASL